MTQFKHIRRNKHLQPTARVASLGRPAPTGALLYLFSGRQRQREQSGHFARDFTGALARTARSLARLLLSIGKQGGRGVEGCGHPARLRKVGVSLRRPAPFQGARTAGVRRARRRPPLASLFKRAFRRQMQATGRLSASFNALAPRRQSRSRAHGAVQIQWPAKALENGRGGPRASTK